MSESTLSGALEALRNDPELGPRIKASESVEAEVAECLEFVDLTVAHSPLILYPGQSLRDAVDVDYIGFDGRYVIRTEGGGFVALREPAVKVARARYLILNGREQAPFIDRLLNRNQPEL